MKDWLAPIFENAERKLALYGTHSAGSEITLMIISVILAVGGIWMARNIYLKKPAIAESAANRFKGLYNLLWNKYFVDEIMMPQLLTRSKKVLKLFSGNLQTLK